MESLFICPPLSELPVIPRQECGERFEQIVRLAFQRKQSSSVFTDTTILSEAAWTAAMNASGNDKLVLSPAFNNVVIPPGEPLTEGGNDNTTINGVTRMLGEGFQQVTFELRNANTYVREALRMLTSETALVPGLTNIWVYMINRFGQVIAKADGRGIDIYNFFVGGVGTEGFNRDNMQMGRFDLAPRWDKDVILHTPSFNPLELLSPSGTVGGVGSLSFTSITSSGFTVTWSAATDAEQYQVQISENSDFSGATQTVVNHPTVSNAFTGLDSATLYYVRVRGIATGFAAGPWSSGSQATNA